MPGFSMESNHAPAEELSTEETWPVMSRLHDEHGEWLEPAPLPRVPDAVRALRRPSVH